MNPKDCPIRVNSLGQEYITDGKHIVVSYGRCITHEQMRAELARMQEDGKSDPYQCSVLTGF